MSLIKKWIKSLLWSVAVLSILSAIAANIVYADDKKPPLTEEEIKAAAEKQATEKQAAKDAKTLTDIRKELNGEADKETIFKLEKLAKKDNIKAQMLLGDLYSEGRAVTANDSLALQWYKAAAKNGDIEGQFKVAELYRHGVGVPFDLAAALEWYTKAAKNNHIEAQKMLGLIYSGNLGGTMIDHKKAKKWLSAASEQGDLEAELALDELYNSGYLPQADQNQALSEAELDPDSEIGKMRLAIKNAINARSSLFGAIKIRGPIRVKKQDDGWFNITVPPTNITTANGARIAFGKSRIKVKPEGQKPGEAEKPLLYRADIKLPLRALIRTADGTKFILTYKQKHLSGIWHSELGSLSESDVELNDLNFVDAQNTVAISAKRITSTINLKKDHSGTWGGPSWFEIAGISVIGPNKTKLVSLGSISQKNEFNGLNLEAIANKIKEFAAVQSQPPGLQGEIEAFKSKIPPFSIGGLSQISLSNIEVFKKNGETIWSLDGLAFNIKANIDMPLASLSIAYKHNGMKPGNASAINDDIEMKGLIPHDAAIKINIKRVPVENAVKEFIAGFLFTLLDVQNSPAFYGKETSSPRRKDFLSDLRGHMDKANTQININVDVNATNANIKADGSLSADAKSKYGVSGGYDISIRGLDKILAVMANNPDTAMTAIAISTFAKLGVIETAKDGSSTYKFHIDLTTDGKLMINGKNINDIMGRLPPPT